MSSSNAPFRLSHVAQKLSQTLAQDAPVGCLRYVSEDRQEGVKRLGISTIRDLLLYLPYRYLDISCATPIAYVVLGQKVTIAGVVDKVQQRRPRPNLSIFTAFVKDETGIIALTFFLQPWIAEHIQPGDRIVASGTVSLFRGFKQINTPFFEVVEGKALKAQTPVVPVHRGLEGLSPAWIRRIMAEAVALYAERLDFIPAHFIAERHLMHEGAALRQAQFPISMVEAERARKRLAYDELLCLQLALRARKDLLQKHSLQSAEEIRATQHEQPGEHSLLLREALPFALTSEQEASIRSIVQDMQSDKRMNRLLLGDVGTGKTVVAAFALALAVDSHKQAAIMAPTSVLAFQYAEKLGPLLDAANISWCAITASMPKEEREHFAAGLATGTIDVAFGTTALLSEDITFKELSLVVVDEQHRFGVNQRASLKGKGNAPDMLSMTATPIPRSLALSVYGDVEVSTIKERPVKGAGVTAEVIPTSHLDRAYKEIQEALDAHHQAYIICPLVDDKSAEKKGGWYGSKEAHALGDPGEEDASQVPFSDSQGAVRRASAHGMYEKLKTQLFPTARIGLLTGRMSAEEKDLVMQEFFEGTIQILVATTVVEVGVDAPNATCMLVMDADMFGLATLHQLRGRVGRGSVSGKVFLHSQAKENSRARKRLEILEKTSDGSQLAELDLQMRHEGEILGYKQSGHVQLRFVDMAEDLDIIEAARRDALTILSSSAFLASKRSWPLIHEVKERYHHYFAGETVH